MSYLKTINKFGYQFVFYRYNLTKKQAKKQNYDYLLVFHILPSVEYMQHNTYDDKTMKQLTISWLNFQFEINKY